MPVELNGTELVISNLYRQLVTGDVKDVTQLSPRKSRKYNDRFDEITMECGVCCTHLLAKQEGL